MRRTGIEDMKAGNLMSKDIVKAGPDDTLSEVLGRMKKYGVSELPVLDRTNLMGIVTMDTLVKRKGLPPSTKVRHIMSTPPQVLESDRLPSVAETLISSGYRALPVVSGKKLVGVISRTDLTRAVSEAQEMAQLRVRDVMTPSPHCVGEDDSVLQARKLMLNLGVKTVPVVNRNRHLVGVIGQKDLAELFSHPKERTRQGAIAGERDPLEIQVKGVMRYPPVTVSPESSVKEAASRMIEHNISSVLVAEGQELVGVVTKADLTSFLASKRQRAQLFVQISGLDEQPHVYDEMHSTIQKAMRKVGRFVTPRVLNLHVHMYKAEGDRNKWSLRLRLYTDQGMYYAKHFDWDLMMALDGLLEQLEQRIQKNKERLIDERKTRHRS